jgi:hypothetical protein
MFMSYTGRYQDDVLIQFSWKGKVAENEDDITTSQNPDSAFDETKGYVAETIYKDYSMFQAQVNKNGINIEQICDFVDDSTSEEELRKYIGQEMFDVLHDKAAIEWLINKQKEQGQKEVPYQNKIEENLRRKRERREEWERRERDRLNDEARQRNREKAELVMEKWNSLIESGEYKNPEFILRLWQRENNYSSLTDQELASTNYAYLAIIEGARTKGERSFYLLTIKAVFGEKYEVTNRRDAQGRRVPTLVHDVSTDTVTGNVGVIARLEGDAIDRSLTIVNIFITKNTDWSGRIFHEMKVMDTTWDERFFAIRTDTPNEYKIFDGEAGMVIDLPPAPDKDRPYSYMPMDENYLTFWDSDGYVLGYYNIKNHTITSPSESGMYAYKLGATDRTIAVGRRGGDFQTIYSTVEDINGLKFPINKEDRRSSSKIYRVIPDNDYYGKQYTKLEFEDGSENIIFDGDDEFVFGKNGDWIYRDGEAKLIWKGHINKERAFITFNRGRYSREENGMEVVCDKYGKTEKDKLAAKNFADWQAQGGHSPEAKAQMDKMWADRNSGDLDYDAKMKDWNDLDRKLDYDKAEASYHPGFEWDSAMQQFPKDDSWRGYVGVRDPEGHRIGVQRGIDDPEYGVHRLANGEVPDYIRRNPWYRIGPDGKPMDQPWYDEDEIPANLSDRVAEEQRINESLNKMRSIWDRMGLND